MDISFTGLAEKISEFLTFQWLWNVIRDSFLWLVNQLLLLLTSILDWALQYMPSMDLAHDALGMLYKPTQVIGYLNWIIPVDVIGFCLNVTAVNIMLYFTISWALRWLKIIE